MNQTLEDRAPDVVGTNGEGRTDGVDADAEDPGVHTRRSPFDAIREQYSCVEKRLARIAPARLLKTIPETGGFVARTFWRQRFSEPEQGMPTTNLTPALVAQVAMDEAILTLAMGPSRFPRRADYERVGTELAEALALFTDKGWLDDPRSYHRDPPPLDRPQFSRGWANGQSYDRLIWTSDYEPHPGEPGRERWLDFHTNRVAGAWMLRHSDGPRPWVVCTHGFGTGYAFMDFPAFNAVHLHRDLGLNVIAPTLPLHGRRKVSRMSGDEFLGFDVMNTVHGLAQALWDVRRIVAWVRATQDPGPIGLFGVSLGAYVASLVCAFDPDLVAVIAGIPVTDFPAMFRSQSPPQIAQRAIEHRILGGPAETVQRVVSPLTFEPAVAHDDRYIFAGTGDRMSHPRQAFNLWKHWDEPTIEWYPGNHVGYLWSGRVKSFVDAAITSSGLRVDQRG